MEAEAAYQFIKPVFNEMTAKEQEKLKQLMFGEDPKPNKKKKPYDPIMSKVEMKKRLMKSHFKSTAY